MRRLLAPVLFVAALVAVFLLGLLAASVLDRRTEAVLSAPRPAIAANEADSAVWGEAWPREYGRYLLMGDSESRTRYGGAFGRDYLEEDPTNVVLFAGYAFAKDYRQGRGHVHAVEDVKATKRLTPANPATCWTCKSADVPVLMGEMGAEAFYRAKFSDLVDRVTHPIGCLDCHDPQTMSLRVSRPALREAFQRMGKDVDRASHQEMRSLVCAQCHVEYTFKGEGKVLTFPWDGGTGVEAVAGYYEAAGFTDWTHAISGTPMVKMQHPDYEVYLSGVHAYRDVACADCHMPYRTEGGFKFTDHHVRSPILDVAGSCAVCHRWSEAEVRSRVESIQDKVREGRDRAEAALARAHFDVAAAVQAGASAEELASARAAIRGAQLRWDYVAANNGMGFHAPQECQRILASALDLAGQARLEAARVLARHGHTSEVRYPSWATKSEAQALAAAFADGKAPDLLGTAASGP
jgi:nitrite reductase (cytochrome c-552)